MLLLRKNAINVDEGRIEGPGCEEKREFSICFVLDLKLSFMYLVLGSTDLSASFYYSMCRCYELLLGRIPILRFFTRMILLDIKMKLLLIDFRSLCYYCVG